MQNVLSALGKVVSFRLPVLFALILLLLGVGGSLYGIKTYPQVLGLSKGAADLQKEADRLVSQVGKLIALPSDEKPTVATITDIDKLKDQPFFKNAKNGDKVLIYTNAKKAILYRESENRIVEVGAVNINQQGNVSGIQNVKFAIYNGAGVSGLTKTMEDKVKKTVNGAEVSLKTNASRADYTDSIIIDLKGNRTADAQSIASALGIKVGTLPNGEKSPDADFLIILGKDQVQVQVSPSPSPSESPSPSPAQ